jgi:hypothetical protein
MPANHEADGGKYENETDHWSGYFLCRHWHADYAVDSQQVYWSASDFLTFVYWLSFFLQRINALKSFG